MSILGIVFGSICLVGACKYAKIWWSMNDDKAGLWALGLGVLAVINFWGSF